MSAGLLGGMQSGAPAASPSGPVGGAQAQAQPGAQPVAPGAPPGGARPGLAGFSQFQPKQPKNIPVNAGIQEMQPQDPVARFTTGAKRKITPTKWASIQNDLQMTVVAGLAAIGPLLNNLESWQQAYDMLAGQKDTPFVNSSNIRLPYIASQLESLVAYIAGTVLVPRLYIVTGNTVQAADDAFKVEKFYNAELLRLRADGSSYFQKHIDFLHMALRDGTGIMEVLWNRRRERREILTYVPKIDPRTGMGMLDPESGKPLWEEKRQTVDEYVTDYPELRPIRRKEFLLFPAESQSIGQAVAVGAVEWLYEDQLNRYVRAGIMDSEWVEKVLSYVPTGSTDVAPDPENYYDKDASQQIGIGLGQGAVTSKYFRNRGPVKVWRIHSRQFDMNDDGEPEENIFWYHELSMYMMGWTPYEYGVTQRPFVSFCPFPRPDQFDGYSLIERLAGVGSEIDATHNQRNDQITFRMSPPMAVQTGSELLQKGATNLSDIGWGPGKILETDFFPNGEPTFKMMQLPDIPLASWQEESLLKAYGNEYTGLNMPQIGGQSAGRRSATEMRQQNAAAGTRLALINTRYRVACTQIINLEHALNKQYLQRPPTTMVNNEVYTLPLDVLDQDFTIGVAGSSDPIDSITRKNDLLSLIDVMTTKFPQIFSDPVKQFYLARKVFEAWGFGPEITQILGTEQDAMQAKQMQMQQHMQATQQQQALIKSEQEEHQGRAAEAQARAMQAMHGNPPPSPKSQPAHPAQQLQPFAQIPNNGPPMGL